MMRFALACGIGALLGVAGVFVMLMLGRIVETTDVYATHA